MYGIGPCVHSPARVFAAETSVYIQSLHRARSEAPEETPAAAGPGDHDGDDQMELL